MNSDDVKELILLRELIINNYKELDGHSAPGTAIIKQASVAIVYENAIKHIDKILKNQKNIKFE